MNAAAAAEVEEEEVEEEVEMEEEIEVREEPEEGRKGTGEGEREEAREPARELEGETAADEAVGRCSNKNGQRITSNIIFFHTRSAPDRRAWARRRVARANVSDHVRWQPAL